MVQIEESFLESLLFLEFLLETLLFLAQKPDFFLKRVQLFTFVLPAIFIQIKLLHFGENVDCGVRSSVQSTTRIIFVAFASHTRKSILALRNLLRRVSVFTDENSTKNTLHDGL